MTNLDYLTNDFIRSEVGIWGAKISDEDCEIVRQEVYKCRYLPELLNAVMSLLVKNHGNK